jgi:hypothetical protein
MSDARSASVYAVQCPRCQKFMLVEAKDGGKVLPCLLCKAPIRVGAAGPGQPPPPK